MSQLIDGHGLKVSRDRLLSAAAMQPPRFMYICCLKFDPNQDEYENMTWLAERVMRYFNQSDVHHVQVAFDMRDEVTGDKFLRTFSSDKLENGVFYEDTKTFNKPWWNFYRIVGLTSAQFDAAYAFCARAVNDGAGFNSLGANCSPFLGWSGMKKSFFCSELTTETLIAAGVLDNVRSEKTTPGDIDRMCRKYPERFQKMFHIALLAEAENHVQRHAQARIGGLGAAPGEYGALV